MTEETREIIISKEDAVFWMDGNGRWHNKHGEFENKKIIDYFNASIGKDAGGYFVGQMRVEVREKVYFKYEVTPLFVFDVITGDDMILLLNTGGRIPLNPDKLSIINDTLFMRLDDEIVKFTTGSMMKIADLIEEEDGRFFFKMHRRRYVIES